MAAVTDYSEYDTLNAVGIVRSCLAAGKPDRIIPALLDHRSADSVEAELTAETARSPERTAPARASAVTPDALAAVIERRFRAQNRQPGS